MRADATGPAQAWVPDPTSRLPAIASRAWIEASRRGLVATLLVTPPVTTDVRTITRIARAIGLASPHDAMPDISDRVTYTTQAAMLHVPGTGAAWRVPAPDGWGLLLREGGAVVVLLSADPRSPAAAGHAGTNAHIRASLEAGRLWVGGTTCRPGTRLDVDHG